MAEVMVVEGNSNSYFAELFVENVMGLLSADVALPVVGDTVPLEETQRVMMRVYGVMGEEAWRVREISRLSEMLPVSATMTRPYIREVLYALLMRPQGTGVTSFTWSDYDALTLPWRCKFGSIHPGDDDDVCPDAFVEWKARELQGKRPGLVREAARVEAFLLKTR